MTDIIEKTREFVLESFEESGMQKIIANGKARYLLQAQEYVVELSERGDPTPLELAALLHGIEDAFEKRLDNRLKKLKPRERSAEIAKRFLKKERVDGKLIKKVQRLILLVDKGKTKESQLLREAAALSFLQNTPPVWFEERLWEGEKREKIIKDLKKEIKKRYSEVKSKRGKLIAKPFYQRWLEWIEKKEES